MKTSRAHLFALLTVTIWSFSYLFIVRIGGDLTPLGVVVARKEIMGLLVVALLLFTRPSLRLTAKQWMQMIAFGLVGGPLYHSVFAWAANTDASGISRIDPGLLGLILATVPVHAGWLGWLLLRERVTITQIIAIVLGLLGVAAVVWGRYGGLDAVPGDRLAGPIAATVAAILASGIAVIMRAARGIYTPARFLAVGGALIVLFTLPIHPFAEMQRMADLRPMGWVAIGFLGLFGSGFGFITWGYALRGLTAVSAATYLFAASVLAALWAWLFDGIPIGWPFAAGAVLVLAGLLVGPLRERFRGRELGPRTHGDTALS